MKKRRGRKKFILIDSEAKKKQKCIKRNIKWLEKREEHNISPDKLMREIRTDVERLERRFKEEFEAKPVNHRRGRPRLDKS